MLKGMLDSQGNQSIDNKVCLKINTKSNIIKIPFISWEKFSIMKRGNPKNKNSKH